MIAYYGSKISEHMTKTPEGFLICHDVPIARIGQQEYFAGELGLDGDPDRLVQVQRRPEDVFDPAAVASFEGKDVTQNHPPERLMPENHALYAKGHAENVHREGDYLVADLHLKDPGLISDVENGVTREVSCGYRCCYTPDGTGYRQTNIRGNHVAIVPRGRARASGCHSGQCRRTGGERNCNERIRKEPRRCCDCRAGSRTRICAGS